MPTKLAHGIRQKRPGYYEVRVYAGVDPKTGKPRQVCRTIRGTIKEANALRAQLLLDIEQHGPTHSGTLAELLDKVIDHLEAIGREPSTIVGYRSIARAVPDTLGRMQVRKLRAEHLDRYYADLLGGGMSVGRVRRYHAFLHRALNQAVRWQWVPDNVAKRTTPPSEPRRQFPIQTGDAVAALIQAAADSREPELAVAFRLLAALGGRRGELCGLRWSDIDLDAGRCRIVRAVKHLPGRIVVGDVKSHQGRALRLDPVSVEILVEHRAAMEHRAAFVGTTLSADAYVLSNSADGSEPWQPNRLTQALRRLRERAGYTGRLHDLRHWHASQLIGSGQDPALVAERLGHRDASTTMKWYAHALPDADERAANLIGDALPRRGTPPE